MFSDHNEIKLEISNKEDIQKTPQILEDQAAHFQITGASKDKTQGNYKMFYMNENKNRTYQSLGGAAKAELRRKFIVLHVYVGKEKNCKSIV